MRTLIIIVGGFVLLGVCLFAGRLLGKPLPDSMIVGAKVFIPLWLAAAGINLWLGTRAGYTVMEELPIFLLILVLPTAAAAFAWWNYAS